MPSTNEQIRDALIAARRGRSLIEMASQPVPATLDDGFRVQAELIEALKLERAGWKAMIAPDGAPAAALMAGPYLKPGDTYEGALGAELRIEIELALVLGRDLPQRGEGAYSRADLLAATDKVVLGVEIVESRLANFAGVPLPLWAADMLGHGGYVVGPEIDRGILDDLGGARCLVSLNGVTLYNQPAVHGNGDPLAPVLAGANRGHDLLGGLKAGQIVTTGSLCGGVLAPGKGAVEARLDPVGSIGMTLR